VTKKAINEAQGFLTIDYEDRSHQIVNVEFLLRRHPTDEVIDFLRQIQREYDRKLKKRIKKDKSDPVINDIVAKRFRLRMAINTIRNNEKRGIAA